MMRLPRLGAVLASGVLLWGGGNGLASIASHHVGAGMVAIFFAAGPIWVATFDAIISRKRPSIPVLSAMILGLIGVTTRVNPAPK